MWWQLRTSQHIQTILVDCDRNTVFCALQPICESAFLTTKRMKNHLNSPRCWNTIPNREYSPIHLECVDGRILPAELLYSNSRVLTAGRLPCWQNTLTNTASCRSSSRNPNKLWLTFVQPPSPYMDRNRAGPYWTIYFSIHVWLV